MFLVKLGLPLRPTRLLSQMGKVGHVTLQHRASIKVVYVCMYVTNHYSVFFLSLLNSAVIRETPKFILFLKKVFVSNTYSVRLNIIFERHMQSATSPARV